MWLSEAGLTPSSKPVRLFGLEEGVSPMALS